MSAFPLEPFLASLATHGIRPTIRDYARISLAMQAGGEWTITRFRDVLLALLAKDEDQQAIFIRRFDEFFALASEAEARFAHVEIGRVLAELRQFVETQNAISQPKPSLPQRARKLVQPPSLGRRTQWRWWAAVGIAVLVIGLAIWHFRPAPKVSGPAISFNPSELHFGYLLVGSAGTQKLTITNTGADSLLINDVSITGSHAPHFNPAQNYSNIKVAPDSSLTIYLRGAPTKEDSLFASLKITSNASDSPHEVPIRAIGIAQPSSSPAQTERQRLYTHVPYVASVRYLPLEKSDDWKIYAGIAAGLFVIMLLYGFFLWRSRKIPEDKPPVWNEKGPRLFSLGAIGGKPAPRLSDETLDQLADAMGYFQSEQPSQTLNVPASIEATGRNGGVPALRFYRRKQIRALLVLEDAFAEATAWNPIAKELAEGISRRGVPVIYGKFNGAPEQFKTTDGSVYRLEDLEDQRRGYLVLIFTDGKGIDRHTGTFSLEALGRWPMVAWIELREPRFWDETSALPTRFGIPIFPATATGLTQAVGRFLTEQATQKDCSEYLATAGQGLPMLTETNLEAYVQQLLGDALPWAQDCAMMPKPYCLSLGLAEALRQRFHPHLPAERIGRLLALPGTQHNVSGLRFSDGVLRALRHNFFQSRDEREPAEVLSFLLEKIKEAEPTEKDSPAHLAWEAMQERVRLELEPDNDLARLAQLAKTPLEASISDGLECYGFPDEPEKIPLRFKPRSKYALQRLIRINESFNVPKLEAYPVAWGHWVVLGLLFLFCISFSALGLKKYFEASQRKSNWRVNAGGLTDTPAKLDRAETENQQGSGQALAASSSWREEASGEIQALTQKPLKEKGHYRLILYGNGYHTTQEFETRPDSLIELSLGSEALERPCLETHPDIGLIVQCCPETEVRDPEPILLRSWRERLGEKVVENRRMSVGLEIDALGVSGNAYFRQLRNTLLQTGSVDVLFRIQPDSSGITNASRQILFELGPLVTRSQLIWWSDAEILSDSLFASAGFDRVLNLGRGPDVSWIAELEKIFVSNEDSILTEQEVRAVLPNASSNGNGANVVMFRPLKKVIEAPEPNRYAFAYYGKINGTQWSKRHFDVLNRDSTAIPQPGDFVVAKTWINARAGYIEFPFNENKPGLFAIKPKDQLRVIEVKDVTGIGGFVWIKFEKLKDRIPIPVAPQPQTGSFRFFAVETNGDSIRFALATLSISGANVVVNLPSGIARELPKGLYRMMVSAQGYKSAQLTMNVVAGKSQELTITLEPILSAAITPAKPNGNDMVLIPAGRFLMGSKKGTSDEQPEHEVYVDAFYMDKTEVTVAQYQKFIRATKYREPSYWSEQMKHPNFPVVYVSWEDADAYAKWAGKKLPTEAQWEYAARGGYTGLDGKKKYEYPWGDEIDSTKANFAAEGLRDVGSYSANGYGLYDMAGNVWEWCADWYDENYYKNSPDRNPKGPERGKLRVLRGGSWFSNPNDLRCAYRSWYIPIGRINLVGFRCVQDVR